MYIHAALIRFVARLVNPPVVDLISAAMHYFSL
jgi:hypothetical protein